ncbi:TadE/TadG family type IV pilus assembly protein [Acidiphilium sp.]|uniref:TadE/TadG family type IV pilus assembly protein n=1 Tax=Acidiphilium sp. TaxID=527 RepID=UPI003CFE4862
MRRGDRRGVAALEFALVLPLMIALLFGVYELSEPMIIDQQVYAAAHSIPASASIAAVQGDGSTSLTYAQVQFAESTIFAEIPALRSGQEAHASSDSVTMSSVVFEPNPSTCVASVSSPCNYNAYVAWSVAYTGGDSREAFNQVTRPCGIVTQVPAGDTAPGTLPTLGVSTEATAWPDPILVVDVAFSYQPLLLTYTKTPIVFAASGLWPVRSVKAASVDASGNATRLLPDQQYTTITGLGSAPTSSYCVNPNYSESGT